MIDKLPDDIENTIVDTNKEIINKIKQLMLSRKITQQSLSEKSFRKSYKLIQRKVGISV